jgi:hypothetical protein
MIHAIMWIDVVERTLLNMFSRLRRQNSFAPKVSYMINTYVNF